MKNILCLSLIILGVSSCNPFTGMETSTEAAVSWAAAMTAADLDEAVARTALPFEVDADHLETPKDLEDAFLQVFEEKKDGAPVLLITGEPVDDDRFDPALVVVKVVVWTTGGDPGTPQGHTALVGVDHEGRVTALID